jgi:hypothetical protein
MLLSFQSASEKGKEQPAAGASSADNVASAAGMGAEQYGVGMAATTAAATFVAAAVQG